MWGSFEPIDFRCERKDSRGRTESIDRQREGGEEGHGHVLCEEGHVDRIHPLWIHTGRKAKRRLARMSDRGSDRDGGVGPATRRFLRVHGSKRPSPEAPVCSSSLSSAGHVDSWGSTEWARSIESFLPIHRIISSHPSLFPSISLRNALRTDPLGDGVAPPYLPTKQRSRRTPPPPTTTKRARSVRGNDGCEPSTSRRKSTRRRLEGGRSQRRWVGKGRKIWRTQAKA